MKRLGLIILLLIGFVKVHANCTTQIVGVPVVESITVDLIGNVTICWQPVADADGIAYYSIFTVNPFTGANDSIDSVFVGTNCYTILAVNNNSDNTVIELGVVAVDICGNPSAVGANYHNTILLEDTFDVCNATVSLKWNAYDDFTSGPNVLYSIYVSINGGGYNLAGTTFSTDSVYAGINQGDIYDFYIEAVENSGAGPFSSTSNDVRSNTSSALKIPAFNYLYSANVIDSTQISIQFYVDTMADIVSYKIKRSTSLNGNYVTVGSVSVFTGMNPSISFTDNVDLNANSTSYYYRVDAINICGVEVTPSNIGRTVWVDVESNPLDATNTITITPYEGWLGGVEKYELYRGVAGVWEISPVTTFSSFTNTLIYEDDITPVFQGDGEYCYKVIAKQNNIPLVGGAPPASSSSNETCALHEPLLYVPNAFIPTGNLNTEFKPVLTFADPESYLFQVYNKWGQVVFETEDVNESWNGTVNNSGTICQSDIYVYLVKFLSARGDEFSKRGKLTLIR